MLCESTTFDQTTGFGHVRPRVQNLIGSRPSAPSPRATFRANPPIATLLGAEEARQSLPCVKLVPAPGRRHSPAFTMPAFVCSPASAAGIRPCGVPGLLSATRFVCEYIRLVLHCENTYNDMANSIYTLNRFACACRTGLVASLGLLAAASQGMAFPRQVCFT